MNIRALHISQILSLKLHSGHLKNVDTLYLAGGGARNSVLRQLIADVFEVKVCMIENTEYAAPFGCAISGAKEILGISYEEAAGRFIQTDQSSTVSPGGESRPKIKSLLKRYAELEEKVTV
ncbi:MAG: hypothetical protein JRF40_10680 [Deltaproteobacteria bacterium]|nr:hypothetical protein [Deltaproteobacteria bacterium]